MPEGLCVPPVAKDEEEQKYMPAPILIRFMVNNTMSQLTTCMFSLNAMYYTSANSDSWLKTALAATSFSKERVHTRRTTIERVLQLRVIETRFNKTKLIYKRNDVQLILDRTKKEYLIGKRKAIQPQPRGKGVGGSLPSYRIRFGQLELITTLSWMNLTNKLIILTDSNIHSFSKNELCMHLAYFCRVYLTYFIILYMPVSSSYFFIIVAPFNQ